MKICVDMDDVLEDLITPWVSYLNLQYGTNVRAEDIVAWDMQLFFPNLTREELFAPLRTKIFWSSVFPKENARSVVEELQRQGDEIFVLTSTHPLVSYEKLSRALFPHFPSIDWKHVILSHHKEMINCDVLLDDGIHNLKDSPATHRFLFEANHNKNIDVSNEIIRVRSWNEFYEKISKIKKEALKS